MGALRLSRDVIWAPAESTSDPAPGARERNRRWGAQAGPDDQPTGVCALSFCLCAESRPRLVRRVLRFCKERIEYNEGSEIGLLLRVTVVV